MKNYAIMLDIRGRRVAIIGGGPVALRKARSALEAGAVVTLICPDPPADVPPGTTVVVERYRPEHLAGSMLVFACTDDRAVNARIARDARAVGALVNAVDQPDDCDFFAPALAAFGDVQIAIGTGGAAPSLAGWLRDRVAAAVPEKIADFAAALGELRELLKTRISDLDTRMAVMKQLAGPDMYDRFAAAGPQALRDQMEKLIPS
ncbi:MAG: bifunctional precorrin-2 dehydrogenase/sirohydrochlorin ferrochelatase [Planctomycetota bacterium]|nr:bifunctional precorrin-2 dehydrogenase/sirohydrochlorin ferrochelatase [Planctomycetota bacterium]